MTKTNAIVGHGRSVHAMRPAADGQLSYEHIKCGAGWTNAGGRMVASKITLTEHEVTCKRCVKLTAAEAAATETVVVVHEFEGNTFEAPMSATEATARVAKLKREPGVTGARIEEGHRPETASERAKAKRLAAARVKREEAAAFRERVRAGMGLPSGSEPQARIEGRKLFLSTPQKVALKMVASGTMHYAPGRTTGPRSGWTRYSYQGLVGGKFSKRTKSVDVLVELGLADLAGSATESCPVILTSRGRELLSAQPTPIAAMSIKVGRLVYGRRGGAAKVIDIDAVGTDVTFRLAVGDFCWSETFGAFDSIPVLG